MAIQCWLKFNVYFDGIIDKLMNFITPGKFSPGTGFDWSYDKY